MCFAKDLSFPATLATSLSDLGPVGGDDRKVAVNLCSKLRLGRIKRRGAYLRPQIRFHCVSWSSRGYAHIDENYVSQV
jgi:hypothetical protein